jgi:hypothetical protein
MRFRNGTQAKMMAMATSGIRTATMSSNIGFTPRPPMGRRLETEEEAGPNGKTWWRTGFAA